MKNNIFLLVTIILLFSFMAKSITVPKDNKASFDVIRKNKIIGSVETVFTKDNKKLILETIVDINLKILFIPAYKFFQKTKEVWEKNQLIHFEGYTDFEDDREFFISGIYKDNNFIANVKDIANVTDEELILDKKILTLNYLNRNILKEKEVFDIQKGIVRKITVKKLNNEIIHINNNDIEAEKYILTASTDPSDKGPFPDYILWYAKNGELLKFQFKNWKDKKDIITQRNNWIEK